ncbi:MAG: autotransporter outer membrane beta-barrel domain-containing protein [Rhodospirillales bacterium]|nr:autotransporter outer membrane beta-barrel domain-containing protein [Rhodospirillales bacterium]
MDCGWSPSFLRVISGFAFALLLLGMAGPAGADEAAARPEDGVLTNARLVRTAVTQTGGAIAARVRALTGGRQTSPLELTPDRHVRLFQLGNAGTVFGNTYDADTRALAQKNGIQLVDLPVKTPFGVWADGAWSRLQFGNDGVDFKGDVWSGHFGFDYEMNSRLTVGVASGYENQNFDASLLGGTIAGNGMTAAPYIVYRLDDNLSLDASGGYTWLDYTSSYRDPFYGQDIHATDADRLFAATDLNLDYTLLDAWHLGGRVGTLYAGNGVDSPFSATTSNGQMVAVGDLRLGYTFDVLDGLEPYVSGLGRYAYADGTANSADGSLSVGTILNVRGARLQLQGTSTEASDASSIYAGLVKLRIKM